MKKEQLYNILEFKEGIDLEIFSSKEFENVIHKRLKRFGRVQRQFLVPDRGDGRRGKIDFVLTPHKQEPIAIEVDRATVRKKSLFKVGSFRQAFCIVRSPYKIFEVKSGDII